MIKAAITISASMQHTMTQDMLKDYVLSSLERNIAQEISKQMNITKQYDSLTDTITYTGTFTNSNNPSVGVVGAVGSSISGISGFNGTTTIVGPSHNNVQEILRVVEYTKNGKITRVELQKYDEEHDSWNKIPRIQIEE